MICKRIKKYTKLISFDDGEKTHPVKWYFNSSRFLSSFQTFAQLLLIIVHPHSGVNNRDIKNRNFLNTWRMRFKSIGFLQSDRFHCASNCGEYMKSRRRQLEQRLGCADARSDFCVRFFLHLLFFCFSSVVVLSRLRLL